MLRKHFISQVLVNLSFGFEIQLFAEENEQKGKQLTLNDPPIRIKIGEKTSN